MQVEELVRKLREEHCEGDLELVERAYALAAKAHEGQFRASGEPYVTHPLAVAGIVAGLRPEIPAVAAALLHDVPEDTEVSLEIIREEFGDEIAHLVDGVTKLGRIRRLSRSGKTSLQDQQAENLRKMFLAMVDDIRVIIIKLSDRLHNMQTLRYLREDKQQRIAQETLDIFAPLANRLGIWEIKWRLEDTAFRSLKPDEYKQITQFLAERREVRNQHLSRVMAILRAKLREENIRAEIFGRPKHIYSIYRKMQEKNCTFDQVYDVSAVRILVQEIRECYAVLGLVHSVWHPISGEFDDYIAMPKDNLYQSLHTAVVGPEGKPLEVQIRTRAMHQVAEYGIAAHWRYKEHAQRDMSLEAKIAWLRQVTDLRGDVTGAGEFMDSVKADVLTERIYVFTPKGDIVDLPAGATPVDLAYYIHSEVGHRCRGAKVDGRLVPLNYQLRIGEQVSIITAKRGGPSRDWLNPGKGYVTTARARQKIRRWFKHQQRDENVTQGREIVERELHRLGMEHESLDNIAKIFKFEKLDDFLAAVGYNDISPQQIANRIDDVYHDEPDVALQVLPLAESITDVKVAGVGDLLTRMARCCNPVPGDEITGYITRGKGVTIHRSDCPNVQALDDPERLVEVQWGSSRRVYPVVIHIEAFDRSGLLRDIATVIADEGINVLSVRVFTRDDNTATVIVTIAISGIKQLSSVLSEIEKVHDVMEARREVA